MGRIRTAVFPVAGLGTRFLPATKAIPKEMLIVGDKPLIQHAVEEAVEAGIERFIFVSNVDKTSLENHFKTNEKLEAALEKKGKSAQLESIRQINIPPAKLIITYQEEALGLGHAVACALPWLDENEGFAILLPDDFIQAKPGCLTQMIAAHNDGIMVASEQVPDDAVSSYGILSPNQIQDKIINAASIIEKPKKEEAPSNYAVIGRYIFPPRTQKYLLNLKPGTGGELHLTDAIQAAIEDHISLSGFLFEGQRFDCGSKAGWHAANVNYFSY